MHDVFEVEADGVHTNFYLSGGRLPASGFAPTEAVENAGGGNAQAERLAFRQVPLHRRGRFERISRDQPGDVALGPSQSNLFFGAVGQQFFGQ